MSPDLRKENLPTSTISALIVIGIEELSPHPSAPAWVRYCTHRDAEKGSQSSTLDAADPISRIVEYVSESARSMDTLIIGSHIGPYHCNQWIQEMTFLRYDRSRIARRVDVSNARLPQGVEGLLEERARVY
jgi:hypothetical protein